MSTWTNSDGQKIRVLVEWCAPALTDSAQAAEIIQTDDDFDRPEELRTLKIEGVLEEGSQAALVYRCLQDPMNLREVLLKIAKPSGDERRRLANIIATQIRSLHVHFRLQHAALRTESFVFFGSPSKPDLTKPYVLDWGRPSSSSIYQHPDYEAAQPLWFYDVWSLLIVLSEIAEWKPVDGAFRDERELLKKKLERKKTVMDSNWKSAETAEIFKYGFSFIEKDRHTLEQLSWHDIKRFYDKLCALLAA